MTPMERWISYVLRTGVVLSATIIIAGVAAHAVTDSTGYAAGIYPTTLRAVLTGVQTVRPYAIVQFGVLALIATPVVRVALSAVFFFVDRDWLYTSITLFVLSILLTSLAFGIG